jgi:hypothetical protein
MLVSKLPDSVEPEDQEEQKELLALENLSKDELETMHSQLLAEHKQDYKNIPIRALRKIFAIIRILRKQKGGPPRTKAPAMRDEDIF